MKNGKKCVTVSTMLLKQKKFISKANSAILQIQKEIKRPARHNRENLQFIKEEIEKMKESLSTIMFNPNYPAIIVDNWHPKDELGNVLLKLYYSYLDLD